MPSKIILLLALTLLVAAPARAQTLGKEGSVGGTKANPTCAINAGNGHVAHVSCSAANASCDLKAGTCSVAARVGTLVYPPETLEVRRASALRGRTTPRRRAARRSRARTAPPALRGQ